MWDIMGFARKQGKNNAKSKCKPGRAGPSSIGRNRIKLELARSSAAAKQEKLERLSEVQLKAGATKIRLSATTKPKHVSFNLDKNIIQVPEGAKPDKIVIVSKKRGSELPEEKHKQDEGHLYDIVLPDLNPNDGLNACINQELGCLLRLTDKEKFKHESTHCLFQPVRQCPVNPECEIARQLLCVHLIIEHGATHVSAVRPVTEYAWRLDVDGGTDSVPIVFQYGVEFLLNFAIRGGVACTWVSTDLKCYEKKEKLAPVFVQIKVKHPKEDRIQLVSKFPLQHLEMTMEEVRKANAGLMLTRGMLEYFTNIEKSCITFEYTVNE